MCKSLICIDLHFAGDVICSMYSKKTAREKSIEKSYRGLYRDCAKQISAHRFGAGIRRRDMGNYSVAYYNVYIVFRAWI